MWEQHKQMLPQLYWAFILCVFLLFISFVHFLRSGISSGYTKAAGVVILILAQFAAPKGQNAYWSKVISNKIKYINE